MIEKLRSIAIFSTVVDQGTFKAAATQLGLAPSRVSEAVSELEKNLGVTLLYRSTRRLALTHEGRLLHDKAQQMLRAAESGLDAINPSSTEPTGELRITAPAFVTQTALMDAFAEFAKAHPRVGLHFDFTDHARDLIRDGFDIAIRAGWLEDSDLLARNIGQVNRLLVASPDYVAARPAVEHPSDLESWDWVRFTMRSNTTELTAPDGTAVSVKGQSAMAVNSADALYEFCVRGLGVSAIPENLAKRGFAQGDLVEVLPDWSLRQLGLHAVWPDQSRRENLTLSFVRYMAESDAPQRLTSDTP
ncbi:MAG: LysR family transcriptional regulator [Pseudomonadota bacterium]